MRKVYRSRENKKIAGICGGLSEIYAVDATLLRFAFVFAGLATGIVPLLATYVVGWIMLPIEPSEHGDRR